MKRLVIFAVAGAALLAAGVAIAVAANSGGSNGRSTVFVKHIAGAGTVLVDSKGRALYRNEQEHGTKIVCTATCVVFWKPLIVTATPRSSAKLSGKLAFVKRPDGRKQATYKGSPLYTFTLDKAGKVTGDGLKDSFGGHNFTWHVEHPSAAMSSPTTTNSTTYTYPGY